MANEPQPEPQEALRQSLETLHMALKAAVAAMEHPEATPGTINGALNGLAAAQQNYNQAIVRIPLRQLTEGGFYGKSVPEIVETEPGFRWNPAVPDASELLGTTNPRKWADTFLAVNKNNAIDRETLVGWFANAIAAGAQSVEAGWMCSWP